MNRELIERIEKAYSRRAFEGNPVMGMVSVPATDLESLWLLLFDCKAAPSQEAEPVDLDLEHEIANAVSEYFQVGFRHGEQRLYNHDDEQSSAQNALTKIQRLVGKALRPPKPAPLPQPVASVPSKEKMRELFTIYHELPYNPKSEHYRFEHFYNAISKELGK